jgi:hypothetical protein
VAVESVEIAGYPVWRTGEGDLEVRFVGRGPAGEREAVRRVAGNRGRSGARRGGALGALSCHP